MGAKGDEGLALLLRERRSRGKSMRYCVVGAGNGGLAMAGHLGLMGFPTALYNRTAAKLEAVRWHGGVRIEGAAAGFGRVDLATSDMAEALEGVDLVMVVTPSTAHRELAALMAPHLQDGQIVVLNPGRTGGALEFSATLRAKGARGRAIIAEAQTFVYASRATSRHEARIFSIKNGVALAALPSYWTPEVLASLEPAYPQFKAGGNVLATSMENIGAVFHPALTILNAGWIEGTGGDFDYYLQGITPSIAKVLERVDEERLAVARALGVRSMSAREWLYLSYDSPGGTLYEAIGNTEAYRGIKAPATIAHRYVFEDLPMSLVPMASLGAMLGVPTPTIDMVIDLGSLMHGVDYRARGRTVESMGLAGLSVREIHRIVTEEEGE
ncbi:MAG TPA: NAD/NADP octopine/nopaline dehydrogenase family protein [Spirochaetia bacterium]|nr:NAD/NADP octopine/nopaline dehydrogenase family protein [Spirochaetia bacterium]